MDDFKNSRIRNKAQQDSHFFDTNGGHSSSGNTKRPGIHRRSTSHNDYLMRGDPISPTTWSTLIPPAPSYPQPSYKSFLKKDGGGRGSQNARTSRSPGSGQMGTKNSGQDIFDVKSPTPGVSPGSSNSQQRHSIASQSPLHRNVSRKVRPALSPTRNSPPVVDAIGTPPKLEPPVQSLSKPVSQAGPNAELQQRQSNEETRRQRSVFRKKKYCKGCDKEITGQFIRALDNAFHIDCFRCRDCGVPCSSKFFLYDMVDPSTNVKYQFPLCEYDYFKRLDLICHNCNSTLRGPYITALGHKYHLEHFKCDICQVVFEADESYYEHEGKIYCHYHYSKHFAAQCEGCKSAIVKQFVELFRGGKNQQWHPECYMVHKFWNVSVSADSVGLTQHFNIPMLSFQTLSFINSPDSDIPPKVLMSIGSQIESTVIRIWVILSGFEEATASCVSDMLMNACAGNRLNGLKAAGKFIVHVEILFQALDKIQNLCQNTSLDVINSAGNISEPVTSQMEYFQPLKKVPRNMCGKIMSYLAVLRKSAQRKVSNSLSMDLLSVITGCAHYMKLVIRIALQNALKVNQVHGTTTALDQLLDTVKEYRSYSTSEAAESIDVLRKINEQLSIPVKSTDICQNCVSSIEKSCVKLDNKRWHLKCFKCHNCSKLISAEQNNLSKVGLDVSSLHIFCEDCSDKQRESLKYGFEYVSDLYQLLYLLKIALLRSKSVMSAESNRSSKVPTDNKSEERRRATEQDYTNTLNDVRNMRLRRQSQRLFNSVKHNARKSIILEAPEGDSVEEDETKEDGLEGISKLDSNAEAHEEGEGSVTEKPLSSRSRKGRGTLKIKDEPVKQLATEQLDRTSDLLRNEKSLTLDDIPRIVAAEQTRELRPNVYKHHGSLYQKQNSMRPVKTVAASSGAGASNAEGRKVSGNQSVFTGEENYVATAGVDISVPKVKYYSELSKGEHFIFRHIAIESLCQLLGYSYNKDELLTLIQTRKPSTFWDKFKWGGGDKKDKAANVFGVDLGELTKRYGVDSDLGVGPSKLRIPIVVDDIIAALRQKDVSAEGIFRLNGNIKKLKELSDAINRNPLKSPDFTCQNAIQLAALLKKWLRDLPNPLLTFNLYDLWISSQKEKDVESKKRILQLIYCMLPRSHRNLLEVLLSFLNWVASFAELDGESGSRMDVYNLATVISPNVLFKKKTSQSEQRSNSGDNYFLVIEVVNQLIEFHEDFSVIPEDLIDFFDTCGFKNTNFESLSSRDIMNRLEEVSSAYPNFFLKYRFKEINGDPFLNNLISRGHSQVPAEIHEGNAEISR